MHAHVVVQRHLKKTLIKLMLKAQSIIMITKINRKFVVQNMCAI